ncbi:VirD4-like conjugal transfer protein, CD1115 family [Enterococcus gallinarum]|uniref:Type IV secretory system conjugative DNA transfer family protein n=1 Tax=Enterococcus gallinarum TaxID=1353 RepID=A0ABD4ZXH9_ENTGA|nr:type IV secretory system conjugative DNA transfer family protein [Enterococcus gallinarum]MBF0825252.1 type IV secretory system conjugative DNA transfer family protein [Enterococcus faecalis]MBF0726926.1 type IV secretory system conjugative DNA transfer family protein [Enterococcus gallinarum]MBF0798897.1 type IV secretory system conjugative DNA transfer family protein [Enterococcus gallinarum]MBX8979381.1 type IV secretory system conjugative DNA transfer family protein [Enterococcus gallina
MKEFREEKNTIFLTKLKRWFEKVDKKELRWKLGVAVFIVCTLIANIISSLLFNLSNNLLNGNPLSNPFGLHMIRYPFIYLVVYLLGIGFFYYLFLQIKINYESLEEGDQATGRFTTLDELIQQYKQVPIKGRTPEETYPGESGTIVARHKDSLFIDTDPAHNYTLGRSRSAKGETKVIPDMDVYSRSEEKPHLIYASGKYELAVAAIAKGTFKRRGYETHILNLIDMKRSFQYNPLDLVKDAYMKGDIDEAIELCKTFSYPLYHNEEAREPVWEETAMALVNAVILALCHEFITKSDDPKKTEKYISLYAVSNMLVELGDVDENGDTLLDKYFANLPAGNPAKLEYSTVLYAKGQMRASIFASTQAKLRQFTAPQVAKLMARSTFDFRKLTKDESPIDMTKKIIVRGYVDTQTEGEYTLTYEITNDFDEKVHVERMVKVGKGLVYQSLPNEDPYFSGVEHIEMPPGANFDPRAGVTCIYRYKPQAVFLVLPDYIQTNYIIASTWISQMYHVASDFASSLLSGKLLKRIRVPLDEFGNLPGFSNIGSMLSVGAGRGILFDFYVQHPNQLTTRYNEKVGEFIQDEAMNKFYLLSGSKKAREDFSSILGNQEVTVKSRSGGVFDLNKQITESVQTRPLVSPDELGRLQEGEVIVERSIHRQDLNGNKVRPYPIFNRGEDGSLLYAHTYLKDQFDPQESIDYLDLPFVPNLPLETYSKEFVARIKNPLAKQEQMSIESRKEEELRQLMAKPEAVLDNEYKDVEKAGVAANLNEIQGAYVEGERKTLIEVYGPENTTIIYDQMIASYPELTEEIDQLEYYEDYEKFLFKKEHEACLLRIQGLGLGLFTKKETE